MPQVVEYRVADGIAWLVINRPEARNALNAEVRAGLWDGVRRFNDDSSAAVLVLTAAGDRAFCAGGDLKEMAGTEMTVPPPDFLPHFGRNIDVPKPTIAAVNGVAYAGGFFLAQQCDLCIAADGARFAITEAKVGRGTPWAVPLPWLVPPRAALYLLMTGEPMGAAQALAAGLVNEVVEPGRLRERAGEIAAAIAANAPLSVRAAKRMVYATAPAMSKETHDLADEIWRPVYLSADAQEGPRAFSEKRRPVWTGQ